MSSFWFFYILKKIYKENFAKIEKICIIPPIYLESDECF